MFVLFVTGQPPDLEFIAAARHSIPRLLEVRPEDTFYVKYGLGVAQRHIVDRDIVGASGRFWGYNSELWHDPATRATVAVLWNDTVLLRSPDVADTLLEVVRLSR
jgi:hypothetical protein